MPRIIQWIKEEIITLIPVIVFFIISFNLIVFTERLMMRHDTPAYLSYAVATVFALVIGKFLIIINCFPFINAFANKPLIYSITWKLVVYGFFILIFRIIEKAIRFTYENHTDMSLYQHLQTLLNSSVFWAIQMWLLMLFCVYIVFSEFASSLGKKRVLNLLLGKNK